MASPHSLPNINLDFGLLRQPREVVFGAGQRRVLPAMVAELGASVAIITDERMSQAALFSELVSALRDAEISVTIFDQARPELPVEDVTAAVTAAQAAAGAPVDVVIGVGGGSCLDLAKVVALVLKHGGNVREYYGEGAVPGPVLPLIAIPTTSGTGSEVTPVAVLSDAELQSKVGISSPHLIPHSAVCDPELTFTSPSRLTASTGADALSHLVEAYTAIRRSVTPMLSRERVAVGSNALTDQYSLMGLELVGRSLRTAVHEAGSGNYRADMMLAAFCGGMAFGTGGTAAAHAFQYPIGALTNTPHGLGVGSLLPYVMAYNGSVREKEMGDIALALGANTGADPTKSAVTAVADLLADIGIPVTLKELGVERQHLQEIAQRGLQARRLIDNNPRPMEFDDAMELLECAYTGKLP